MGDAVDALEIARREMKTRITDYGADCGGFQTHDGRGTLEAALAAGDAYATEKALAALGEAEAVVRRYFPGNESILEEFRALRGSLAAPPVAQD